MTICYTKEICHLIRFKIARIKANIDVKYSVIFTKIKITHLKEKFCELQNISTNVYLTQLDAMTNYQLFSIEHLVTLIIKYINTAVPHVM